MGDINLLWDRKSGSSLSTYALGYSILKYSLQIMAFVTDNASNNNTLIDGIVERAKKQGILMNGTWARLRCMPHTVHLAALKVSVYSVFFPVMIL